MGRRKSERNPLTYRAEGGRARDASGKRAVAVRPNSNWGKARARPMGIDQKGGVREKSSQLVT